MSKQAELRRLMKLQKERTATAEQQQQQQRQQVTNDSNVPTSSLLASKAAPLPKSILKTPGTAIRPPPIIAALADYGSSSSEGEDQEEAATTSKKPFIQWSTAIDVQTIEARVPKPQQPRPAPSSTPTPAPKPFTATEAARIQQEEDALERHEDTAWNEFQAMINEGVVEQRISKATVFSKTKKHSSIHNYERGDDINDEIPDTATTTKDMEQASFEARIAVLKNRQKSKSTTTTPANTVVSVAVKKRTFDSSHGGPSALHLLRMKRAKEQRLAASIDDDD
jgi:hypothetical protein